MASRLQKDLESLNTPPHATVEYLNDAQTAIEVCFKPHESLWNNRPVLFELRVPLSYPSMPPVVSCRSSDVFGLITKGRTTSVDGDGRVSLQILSPDTNGWNKSYTISHVLHSLHVVLRKPGAVVKVPIATPGALPSYSSVAMSAGEAGVRGRRPTMEDATHVSTKLPVKGSSATPTIGFFAVYDGHGGRAAADYASRHVHELVVDELAKGYPVPEALYTACTACDKAYFAYTASLSDMDERDAAEQAGTTACIMVQQGTTLYTANLGDSRAVLCRGGTALQLSQDQKPSSPDELARIVNLGGFVINNRVLGYLAVARALGDANFKSVHSDEDPQLVSAEPDVSICELSPADEFIVMACDGLFDVMTSKEVIDFARPLVAKGRALDDIASDLAAAALAKGSTDNVSVVVITIAASDAAPAARSAAATSTATSTSTGTSSRMPPTSSASGNGSGSGSGSYSYSSSAAAATYGSGSGSGSKYDSGNSSSSKYGSDSKYSSGSSSYSSNSHSHSHAHGHGSSDSSGTGAVRRRSSAFGSSAAASLGYGSSSTGAGGSGGSSGSYGRSSSGGYEPSGISNSWSTPSNPDNPFSSKAKYGRSNSATGGAGGGAGAATDARRHISVGSYTAAAEAKLGSPIHAAAAASARKRASSGSSPKTPHGGADSALATRGTLEYLLALDT